MLRRDGIAYLWKIGNRLIEGLNAVTREHEIGYRLTGLGPMPTPVTDAEDQERVAAWLRGCLARGAYIPPCPSPFFCPWPTREADIEETIQIMADAAQDVSG